MDKVNEMTAAEKANKIERDMMKDWPADREKRATLVAEWCIDNGIESEINAAQLAAGMGNMPYYSQSPANYLDFVIAYHAARCA